MLYFIRNTLKYWFIVCLLGVFNFSYSQAKNADLEFGLSVGRMVYQGDLTPSILGSFQTSRSFVGFTAAKNLSSSFALRVALLIGNMQGNDAIYAKPAYRRQRNFSFTSSVKELTAQAVYSFPGIEQGSTGFTGYVFGGGGLSALNIVPNAQNFNPEYFGAAETARIQSGLASDAQHGTPKLLPLLIVGVGMKYFIKPKWGVNAEASYRFIYTDYLDGFSESANPAYNDHYMNYSIGVVYRPDRKGSALDCPKIY